MNYAIKIQYAITKLKHTGITPTQGTDIGHDKTKVVQVHVTTRKYKGETRKSLDWNEEPRTATDLSIKFHLYKHQYPHALHQLRPNYSQVQTHYTHLVPPKRR